MRTVYAALDADLFRRALGYLIENGIKFTPAGSIRIEVKSALTEGSESVAISAGSYTNLTGPTRDLVRSRGVPA